MRYVISCALFGAGLLFTGQEARADDCKRLWEADQARGAGYSATRKQGLLRLCKFSEEALTRLRSPVGSRGIVDAGNKAALAHCSNPSVAAAPGDTSVRCAEAQLERATQQLRIVRNSLDLARRDLPLSSALLDRLHANLLEAEKRANASAVNYSAVAAQYGFYIGPNFSLGGDGSWRPGGEFLLRADTEAYNVRWLPKRGWLRGYFETSYQSINALEVAEGAAAAPGDLFAEKGGFFRLNAGLQAHFTDWVGVQGGVGLSSLPNTEARTQTEPRVELGAHFQTVFPDRSYGSVFVGAAHDKFWRTGPASAPEENFRRYVVDALIVPGAIAYDLHIAARLHADAPQNGRGPSDVRVSVLFYYDLSKWLSSFRLIKDTAQGAAETLKD